MIRDYEQGVHETLDVTIVNAGSGKNAIRADGMFKNAFYDFALYSDSGYTTPISASAYETPTSDAYYTSQEIGFTDETVYSEYRVLDPTYQTGTIYARFESFGIYTSGAAVGQDYIVLTDANYAFTIEPTVYNTILDCTAFTADRTITLTQGTGANIRNKVTIMNPTAYIATVTDTTDDFLLAAPYGTADYWFNSTDDLARSPGLGLIFEDTTPSSATVTQASLSENVVSQGKYIGVLSDVNGFHEPHFYVKDAAANAYSASGSWGSGSDFTAAWTAGSTSFTLTGGSTYWYRIYRDYP